MTEKGCKCDPGFELWVGKSCLNCDSELSAANLRQWVKDVEEQSKPPCNWCGKRSVVFWWKTKECLCDNCWSYIKMEEELKKPNVFRTSSGNGGGKWTK